MRHRRQARRPGDRERRRELRRLAAPLVVGQAEADHLPRTVAGVVRGQPRERARLQRVPHPRRGDDHADVHARVRGRLPGRVQHDLQRGRQAADERRVRRRVHLDLEPARPLRGVVLRRLRDDPSHVGLAAHARPRRVVQPLEPEPAALVGGHVQRVGVEERGRQPDAVRRRQVGQRRDPHRPGEVQVQVGLREQGQIASRRHTPAVVVVVASISRYPTPRTVSKCSAPTLRRRYRTYTSTTLEPGSKSKPHTSDSRRSRVRTSPG